MKPTIVFVAMLIAIARLFITPRLTNIPTWELSYEAVAHLFDGWLILLPVYDWQQKAGPSRQYGLLGLALALWELGMFVVQKLGS